MKATLFLFLGLCAGFPALAAEAPSATANSLGAPPDNALSSAATPTQPADTNAVAATVSKLPTVGSEGLVLNFRNAPLDMVLDYLSQAAGFIIIKEARVSGTVNVISEQPLTKDEAVDLLNSVLNRNGYGALRNGRTLTIVSKDEIKTRGIPVVLWNGEPDSIPRTDEVITAILPVRFVEAAQLMKDLQPLISPQTAMTANESGNSIVITDTQANIHRVAEVIKAIDMGAEDVTVVKVFHLQHSNPQEMSDLLGSLFPDDSRSGATQAPMQFGGFRGFGRFFGGGGGGGGPFGGGQNNANAGQNARIKKRNRVIAAADLRTSALVVTAAKDLMDQIEAVVTELDSEQGNNPTVAMFRLENAEPTDALQVLQDIFNKNGVQNNNSSRNNQQNNILQNRSIQQNQQYNNNSSSRMGTGSGTGGRSGFGGGGGGGF